MLASWRENLSLQTWTSYGMSTFSWLFWNEFGMGSVKFSGCSFRHGRRLISFPCLWRAVIGMATSGAMGMKTVRAEVPEKTSPWWFFPICVRGGFPDNNKRQRQSTACFSGHSLSAISQATLGLTSCTISFVTQDDHCCTTNSFFVLGACRSCERERERTTGDPWLCLHMSCVDSSSI